MPEENHGDLKAGVNANFKQNEMNTFELHNINADKEKTEDGDASVTLEELVGILDELHDLLIRKTEPQSTSYNQRSLGLVAKDKGLSIEDFSSESDDFTEQLLELRNLFVGHEEDMLYPAYDELNSKLDELKGFLNQSDDKDSTGATTMDAGLKVLMGLISQNAIVTDPNCTENCGPPKNKEIKNFSMTDDQRLHQIRDFEEALNRYNRSSQLTPQHLDALHANNDSLPKIFEEEISLEDLVNEGRQHMQNREFEKALRCFERALELDPLYLDAWSAKGDLMVKQGQEKRSIYSK